MYMYLPYITLVGINENSDNGPYDHDRRNPFADNPENGMREEEPDNGTRDIDDDDHDNDDEKEDENEVR